MRFVWPLLLALSGCALPLVGSLVTPMGLAATAGATTGTWALQQRGVGGAVSDNALALAINDAWLRHDMEVFRRLSTGVLDGRVMLTGTVDDAATHAAALEVTRNVAGVAELIDEVMIREDIDLGTAASDRWINTRLRAELTLALSVSAVNYSLDTVDSVVFILGLARDAAELEQVIALARDTSGVRGVVTHVRLISETVIARQ